MKKEACILLLAISCMNMAIAMEEEEQNPIWGIGSSIVGWVGQRMNDVDQFFEEAFNLDPIDKEKLKESPPTKLLLKRLNEKNKLSAIFEYAIAQGNQPEFLMLVQGLKGIEAKPEKETASVIKSYLELMQKQHAHKTKELLQKEMHHAAILHHLLKPYRQEDGQQDSNDANFSNMVAFVRSLEQE